MKKQKKKQEKLIMKMLPKAIIEKVMEGGATTVADTFDNATLYFSAVDGFIEVSRHCRYVNVLIHFSSLTLLFGFWIKYILESIEIKSFRFSALQLVKFLNKLYNTMDKRMDKHDVYKVETISDQYLVVSGVPKKNGDKYVFLNIVLPFVFLKSSICCITFDKSILYLCRHAAEICNMALDLKAACGSVVRPDIAPRTITIRAGVHTG